MKAKTTFDNAPTFSANEKKDVYSKKENCSPIALISPFSIEPSFDRLNIVTKFPWIKVFTALCQDKIPVQNMASLEKLMNSYYKEVRVSVNECYSRPNRAAKLMKTMSDTLMFFHMIYTDLKLPLIQFTYLKKMSDLMAMYLDMEIKAFSKAKENRSAIATRIMSSFHIYFGKSQDHMVDTILKARFIQGYKISGFAWKLYDLIFQRLLRDFSGTSLDFISYFRYLLVFKLWVTILKREPEKRTKVCKLACMKLQAPSDFREKYCNTKLQGILPASLKSSKGITKFLMEAKFSISSLIKWFLKALEDPQLKYLQYHLTDGFTKMVKQNENSDDTFMEDIYIKYEAIDFLSRYRKKNNRKQGRINAPKKCLPSEFEVIVIDDESDSEISTNRDSNNVEQSCVKVEVCKDDDFSNIVANNSDLDILQSCGNNKIEDNFVKVEVCEDDFNNIIKDKSDLEIWLNHMNSKIDNAFVKLAKPQESDFSNVKESNDTTAIANSFDEAKDYISADIVKEDFQIFDINFFLENDYDISVSDLNATSIRGCTVYNTSSLPYNNIDDELDYDLNDSSDIKRLEHIYSICRSFEREESKPYNEETQTSLPIDPLDPSILSFSQPTAVPGKDQGSHYKDEIFNSGAITGYTENSYGRRKFKTPAELKQSTTSRPPDIIDNIHRSSFDIMIPSSKDFDFNLFS